MQAKGSNERQILDHEDHWTETWASFNQALRSPDHFNAPQWVCRLLLAALYALYYKTGLRKLKIHLFWRSCVPAFAIGLIVAVVSSYFLHLRPIICDEDCRWPFFHDITVSYFGVMIIFNYLSACFRSPGVAMAECYNNLDELDSILDEIKWTAANSQGGCCCFNTPMNLALEKERVSLYKTIETSPKNGGELFPSNVWTKCAKCNINRPPRCHHCSICNRCVLQFDHHCVWLNNCVGYNNHRSFLLTLFFLTLGCWYGFSVLFFPFYLPLKRQVAEHGFHFLYDNKTGFLDIPPPWTLISTMFSDGLDPAVIIKIVFPLLAAVGLLQTFFLASHITYVVLSRTTLEHQIILDKQYKSLTERKEIYKIPPNPFDYGWLENLRRTLGPINLIFLPIPVEPIMMRPGESKKMV